LRAKFSDVHPFLPTHLFTEKGGRKLEVELSAISLGSQSNISALYQTLVRLVGEYALLDACKGWRNLCLDLKVPTSAVIEGLHRRKTVREKNKDKIIIKKPKRPSKRIEVLSEFEREIIQSNENSFTEYKNYIKSLDKEIPIANISKVRERISADIQSMWLCVEKCSAPLTKRRTPLLKRLTQQERAKVSLSKPYVQDCITNKFSWITDRNDLYTLSPIPLIMKVGSKQEITSVSLCSVETNYVLIPVHTVDSVGHAMNYFAKITDIPVVNTREKRAKRSKGKHNKNVSTFTDSDKDESNKAPSIQITPDLDDHKIVDD
jgi:hypothetical protein